jgi:hypothetical protein
MTKLQQRIMGLIRKGKSTSQIMSETKASATYVRRFVKRSARVQAPVRVQARVEAITNTANGHLSIEAIEAKANEHLEKAAELRRAAEALRSEGLIS